MTFYTGLTILVELFMLAMIIHVMRYSGISKSQRAWFLVTFLAIMLCAAAAAKFIPTPKGLLSE
jgi:uncharacterized protein involved in exopolysaccharide biosynthesis